MRLPRPAVALLVLGALTCGLGVAGLPAAGLARAVVPTPAGDPGTAVRGSRALLATLPAAPNASTTAGSVRLTDDPVTGSVCLTTTGITAAPGTIAGLSLAAPDGTRVALSGADLGGCAQLAPTEAAAVLASPTSYSLILTAPDGDLAAAPLALTAALTRPWHVGTRSETLVDTTRGTARRGRVPATRSRVIRLTYYYPDRGDADGSGVPASPEGPFPVVVFSPGYAVTPATYARTLHAWAAAGYLVVGVLSPGSGGGLPGTPTEADLTAQPHDLSLALTAVQRHTADPSSWLGGVADTSRVAVSGHSDGGSTATASGLLQRYSDSRWKAVLVMAGASFGGAPARKSLPLLLLSGQRDEYNAPSTFAHVFALGHTTRAWVQAVGARHLPPFTVTGRQADDLRALEIAFFDRSLLGARTAPLERALSVVPGVTRIAAGSF